MKGGFLETTVNSLIMIMVIIYSKAYY